MKRLIPFIFILSFYGFLSADLIDVYKKGEIRLVPDKDFGKSTDWESLNFYGVLHAAVVPDGSIFISSSKEHKIYKFDENGNFILKFGKKGQGPGDFYHPGELSILDNKHLVIGEYASNQRISLFDLNGEFIKLIKAEHPVFDCVALKNNKIAFVSHKYDDIKGKKRILIFIRDLNTDKETLIASFTEEREPCRNCIRAPKYEVQAYISRTKNGNLLVGFSNTPTLNIYSPEGKKINTFNINMEPIKVTKKMKEEFYRLMERNIEKRPKYAQDIIKKQMRKMKIFPEYKPYYENIIRDNYGNTLVFYNNGYAEVESCKFQVYSPDGNYVCESKIILGKYRYSQDPNIPTVFHNDSLYCLPELKNTDDYFLRIIKVNLR